MKKFFTLFVALMAVVSLSAKTIYLVPSDDWKSYGAVFFIHSWGGAADKDVQLTAVDGEDYLFSADIPDDNTSLLFVRAQGESTSIPWDTENLWNKTGDQVIPADKSIFWIMDWTNGVWIEKWLPSASIVGNFEGEATWGKDAHPLVPATDKKSASVTIHLEPETYEMKVWVEGYYLSLNGAENEQHEITHFLIHRAYNHAENVNLVNDGNNFDLKVDVAGDYTFTWTYGSRNLVVTFPATTPTEIISAAESNKAVKRIVNGQLVIERDGVRYNALGAEVR